MSIIERALATSNRDRDAETETAKPVQQRAELKQVDPVDYSRLMASNLLRISTENARTLAQFRRIKRPLLLNAFGELAQPGSNIVLVTSASAGAGKSFTAANLAYSLSRERDLSVLLVDADNTKASLTKAMELSGQPGFFDALDNSSYLLESVLRNTDVPSLDIMPTGSHHRDSEEILASRVARERLLQLAKKGPRRIILLDAPPVLPSPDALALARLSGQIVLVVSAGKTEHESLAHTIELLGQDKPLGLVLNRAPMSRLLPGYQDESYSYYGD